MPECAKKAFISQPMKGKTVEAIRKERKRLEDTLLLNGYVAVDSVFEDFPAADADCKCVPLAYLAKSLELLAKCDGAAFAAGWNNARGCQIEHACCEKYGIPILAD